MKEIKVTTEYNLFEVTVEPKETKVHIVAADLEELQDILDNEEYKRDVDDINHCIPTTECRVERFRLYATQIIKMNKYRNEIYNFTEREVKRNC